MADGTTDRLRAHSVSRNGDAEFFDAHSYMHASLPLDTGLIGASAPTDLTPPHPDLQAVMNAHDTLGFCNDHQPASDRHAMSIGQEQESNMTASTMDPATMDLTLAQHIVARPFEQAQCSTSYFESYGGESSGSAHMPQAALKHHNSSGDIDGMEAFPTFKMERQRSESNLAVDPSLLTRGDPNSIGSVPGIHDSEIAYDPMASAASPHAFTPPHLMPDMTRHHSEEDQHIAATSPNFQCPDFGAFPRPRAPSDSLDPASANFTTNWNTFGTHRRTASDQYSDYSSHSNHASPYMPTLDSFDGAHSSPLLDSSQDPVFNDGLGLQGFSLNDDQQTTQTGSPAHSPIPSPRLNPQPQLPLPQFDAEGMIGVPTGDRPADLFAPLSHGYYPAAHAMSVPKDFGLADQMSPPEINIDFAPPSRPIEQHNRPVNDGEALSPLMRCMSMFPVVRHDLVARRLADSTQRQVAIGRVLNPTHLPVPEHQVLSRPEVARPLYNRTCMVLVGFHFRVPPTPRNRDLRPEAEIVHWVALGALVALQAIATICLTWHIQSAHPQMAVIAAVAGKDIPQHLCAVCAPSGSRGRTIFALIIAPTPTNDHLNVQLAAKPLRVSTTASATRACILARRSSFVMEISRVARNGAVVGDLRAPMLWGDISVQKQGGSASSDCSKKTRSSGRGSGLKGSSSAKIRLLPSLPSNSQPYQPDSSTCFQTASLPRFYSSTQISEQSIGPASHKVPRLMKNIQAAARSMLRVEANSTKISPTTKQVHIFGRNTRTWTPKCLAI